MNPLTYPFTYEEWVKHPQTIKAMKIIMTDYNNRNQLKLDL